MSVQYTEEQKARFPMAGEVEGFEKAEIQARNRGQHQYTRAQVRLLEADKVELQ